MLERSSGSTAMWSDKFLGEALTGGVGRRSARERAREREGEREDEGGGSDTRWVSISPTRF